MSTTSKGLNPKLCSCGWNPDGDSLNDIAEYGLGTNPNLASQSGLPFQSVQAVNVGGVVSDYLTLTYTRAIGRDDANYSVEASADLGTWVLAIGVGSPTFNGNGTETLVYRYPNPKASDPRQFLRLRINKVP